MRVVRLTEACAVTLAASIVACRPPSVASAPTIEPTTAPEPDRTPVATEPSPARHIGAGNDTTECPMHLNGPSPDESVNEWLGWSARLLHLCQGDPDERSEERWIYNLPQGCSELRSEITVVFEEGVVVSAKVKNRHTGEHCDF